AEKRQVSRTRGLREKINNGKAIPTPKAKAPDKTAEGATVLTKNASEGKPVVESSR
ncbi:MAG: hypothetical protein HFJ51_01865, partial [Clostridia bacterium]|nr:hypothetical protein [Clostridia bacterium]